MRRLRALNMGSIASARSKMCMNIGNARIRKHRANRGLGRPSFGDGGIDDHIVSIVGAQRQQANAERFGDHINELRGPRRAFQNINRMARTIWSVCRLMDVVDQKHVLSRRGVTQFNPIGMQTSLLSLVTAYASRAQLIVVEPE